MVWQICEQSWVVCKISMPFGRTIWFAMCHQLIAIVRLLFVQGYRRTREVSYNHHSILQRCYGRYETWVN